MSNNVILIIVIFFYKAAHIFGFFHGLSSKVVNHVSFGPPTVCPFGATHMIGPGGLLLTPFSTSFRNDRPFSPAYG